MSRLQIQLTNPNELRYYTLTSADIQPCDEVLAGGTLTR